MNAMRTPVTTLDQRFSEPTAVATSWAETLRAIEAAELFWISTVRADGRPHVTPLVAAWSDGALWFHTGAGEQKFANLRANPQVALTTGCNGWEGGLDVVVEGEARQSPTRPRSSGSPRRSREVAGAWQFTVRDGRFYNNADEDWPSEVFSVTPARVFAHAKGDRSAPPRTGSDYV